MLLMPKKTVSGRALCRQLSQCRLGNNSHCALQIGYQFMMRWVNNHIYYLKARSPLGKRILEQVADLPFEATGQCCLQAQRTSGQ